MPWTVRHISDRIAGWFRPWTTSSIPEHLALPPIEGGQFQVEHMRGSASLSAGCNMEFGIFAFLGADEAHLAISQWRPGAILAMEEVSLSWYLVDQQRQVAEIVSRQNIERLAYALTAYYERSGRPRDIQDVRSSIEQWLAEHASPHATTVSQVHRQIAVQLPLLHELHLIDKEISQRVIGMHGRPATLSCVGLRLDAELDASRYPHCTPHNCRTFASTGGDGSHFSLLVENDAITENSPVILTAPDACGLSVPLASSLREFLKLGSQKGYFGLGHISEESPDSLTEYLAGPLSDFIFDSYQVETLKILGERLDLKPWTDDAPFRAARERYAPKLLYPPDVYGQ